MKTLLITALTILLFSCKTTKLDHTNGDVNPTAVKRHFDKIHKIPWHAGNDLITPTGFKPIK